MKSLIVALALIYSPLSAEMYFESKQIDLKAKPEDDVVNAVFYFEIREDVVELEKLDAPCTCLLAKIEPTLSNAEPKTKWKVGEKGKVMARFELSTFRGMVEKNIYLKVKGEKNKINLKVKIDVPELVEVTPVSHLWTIGGNADVKTFKIKVNHSEPIHIKEHSGKEEDFPYELVAIKDGWEYEVKVHPRSTKLPRISPIVLFTDSTLRKYKRYQVYTIIKKSESSQQ